MLPKQHVIIGFIFSLMAYIIFPISPLEATIIFLASFLIDFDHYLLYVYKKKNLSLNRALKYFYRLNNDWKKIYPRRKEYKKNIFIFHSIETLIPLAIFSIYFPIVWFVLIGMILHLILDYSIIIKRKAPWYCKFSIILTHLKNCICYSS